MMTSKSHDEYLEEISDYLLDQAHAVPQIEFAAGDVEFIVGAVHREKFDRSVGTDIKTLTTFKLSACVTSALYSMLYPDGSVAASEGTKNNWLSVADALELEAKRIRNVMARAEIIESENNVIKVVSHQKLTG